jgi:hypothetical protein
VCEYDPSRGLLVTATEEMAAMNFASDR